jgi:hypothetical protein
VTVTASPRDPRRSLILGSVIAGVVLLVVVVLIVFGLLTVFLPRSADPEDLGRPRPAASVVPADPLRGIAVGTGRPLVLD